MVNTLALAFFLLISCTFLAPSVEAKVENRDHEIHHPLSFSVPLGDPVALRIDESVRYQLDGEEAIHDWAKLMPSGGHTVFLDSDSPSRDPEPYTVTMFHQFKCLDILRDELIKAQKPETQPEFSPPALIQHCTNYLRQAVLCNLNMRLEFVKDAFGFVSRAGYDAVCKDWTLVYEEAERNHEAYLRRYNGSSSH